MMRAMNPLVWAGNPWVRAMNPRVQPVNLTVMSWCIWVGSKLKMDTLRVLPAQNEDVPTPQWRGYVKTYAIDVNMSRASEECPHSSSWPNGPIVHICEKYYTRDTREYAVRNVRSRQSE
jgi:hypothetical protein